MEQNEDIVARVKEQADIVQVIGELVDLKRSGARFLGLCPFHGEKTPSFSVHPGNQFFHCFGCGESGDVFSFVMKSQNMDFGEALRHLAQKYQIEIPERHRTKEEEVRQRRRKALFGINNKASEIFCNCLVGQKIAEQARAYLKRRGVTKDIVERYRIGYAPAVETAGWNFLGSQLSSQEQEAAIEVGLLVKKEQGGTYDRFRDRILFPVFDISGQVCGFGGRIVGEGQPKYMNSPESIVFNKSKLLLGLYQQKDSVRKKNQAILVEGNFDLVSLVANGCENVVAPLGTALTREQLRLIKRFAGEAILLFDGDNAGKKAAERAVALFLAEQLAGRVVLLPEGHDPDTFIREHGLAKLNGLFEKAEELPEFLIGRLVEQFGLGLDGKRKIVEELGPLVKAAASPLQRSVVISHFADRLGLDPQQLENNLQEKVVEVPSVETRNKPQREPGIQPLSLAQKQVLEYMILNPGNFKILAENRVRECLEGTIGEVLYLELRKLLEIKSDAEPEELLTLLPDGGERTYVVDLLFESSKRVNKGGEGGPGEELEGLLTYLKHVSMKSRTQVLVGKIEQAQLDGDQEQVMKLLSEQVALNRELKGVEVGG